MRHPYMVDMRETIGETLRDPEVVRLSNREPGPNPGQSRLYYRWYDGTAMGDKWVCVVALFRDDGDAFVLSAYVTERLKRGIELWRTTERTG